MWTRHVECAKIIFEGWHQTSFNNLANLAAEVKHCGKLLSTWNREVFGNVQAQIKRKEVELRDKLTRVVEMENFSSIDTCRRELQELSIKEEIL